MPYTATSYTTGGTATAADLDHGETQYTEATLSFNPDLFTAFVYSGLVATKDGTTLNQLDVTSGKAYLLQTDGTLRQRVLTSSTQTTATASTTYYLDLNPDGSWSWGTAHSATANYLPIASVTTDASGNISTVTDARGLNTTLLTGMAGNLTVPGSITATSFNGSLGGGITSYDNAGQNTTVIDPQRIAGSARGYMFQTWDGTTSINTFSVGTAGVHGTVWIEDDGRLHAGQDIILSGALAGTSGYGLGISDNGYNVLISGPQTTGRGVAIGAWSGSYFSYPFIASTDGSGYIGIPDNGFGSVRSARHFEGGTDPATYTTVGEGEIWYDG